MLTAAAGNFSGDQATVDAGATINGAGTALTVNKAAPSGTTHTEYFGAMIALDYTRYGSWADLPGTSSAGTSGVGHFVGGYQTPPASMPVSGMATYNGKTIATYGGYPYASTTVDTAAGYGDVTLTAYFGSGTVTGLISNLIIVDEISPNALFNDLAISASITPSSSSFAGTITAQANPGTLFGVTAGSTGVIKGLFFGPAVQEVGGVWFLTDGTTRILGSFGAKQ